MQSFARETSRDIHDLNKGLENGKIEDMNTDNIVNKN